jgi:2-beta-glucuronyltransferase
MPERTARQKAVVISSVHDYRVGRRGSIQAIADGLARRNFDVLFLSIRFSLLSFMKPDSRRFLLSRANTFENLNGIRCYLWRTPLHPFTSQSKALQRINAPLHKLYAACPNAEIDRELCSASHVIVESGLGIALIERIRRLNPGAKIIYRASDKLNTIGAHPYLQQCLQEQAHNIDHICLLARLMAPDFAFARDRTYVVPLGVHPPDFADIGASPYAEGLNAVSVGSMLFDPSFFETASELFPDVTFHVIGSGHNGTPAPNVRWHPEMPFKETLPYIAHAAFGIAPYRQEAQSPYLAQSSLKLMQYEYLGIPGVCPHYAAGGRPSRFGYTPGDREEIREAVTAALAHAGHVAAKSILTWDEVIERMLSPADFPETRLAEGEFDCKDRAIAKMAPLRHSI